MENRVMTQEELQAEVKKAVDGYREHCVKQNIQGERLKQRVEGFDRMLRMAANEFQLARQQEKIPGELVDWMDFYHGFLSGVEYGQQMAADAIGHGDAVRGVYGK